jgi:hypothetical protein
MLFAKVSRSALLANMHRSAFLTSPLSTGRPTAQPWFHLPLYPYTGRDSSVGIATRYWLDDPGIEYRWGARLFSPMQTGPGAHPASCTMGTGSFPGVKQPVRGVDHPPPSKCRGHEREGLYLYSPSGPSWPVIRRTFTFTYIRTNF